MDETRISRAKEWEALQKAQDDEYRKELEAYDPALIGLAILCPDCKSKAWVRLPEKRYAHNPIMIACPSACGAYYGLESFSPQACDRIGAGDFDVESVCKRDGTSFAMNGALFRCPTCGIENPREVMHNLTSYARSACAAAITREDLVALLGRIVSTFDGVMRKCNMIAIRNLEVFGVAPIANVESFQGLVRARDKLLPRFDMASVVKDWPMYVRIFQKRHLFSHSLGVVDAEYLRKTGDTSATLGKQITLDPDEVVYLAESSESIVNSYFGMYLS